MKRFRYHLLGIIAAALICYCIYLGAACILEARQ